MRGFMQKYLYAMIFSVVLVSFTAYALLDTFVIPREYSDVVDRNNALIFATATPKNDVESDTGSDADAETQTPDATEDAYENESEVTQNPTDTPDDYKTPSPATATPAPEKEDSSGEVSKDNPVITENSYDDGNIKITITQTRYLDTEVYIADVTVSSAEYLRTAFAKGTYGRNINETTSEMAEDNGAIFAVNGDYYGSRSVGYVIRNGVLYRSKGASDREDLVIYANGTFDIVKESQVSAQELLNNGAYHVLSFGPGLVETGNLIVSKNATADKEMQSNPRCAIGVYDPLHYVFVVSDGRTDESAGLSLYELGQFMQNLGVSTAYNLDGGGSATMYFNGRIVNKPTTYGNNISERDISDIIYIGY